MKNYSPNGHVHIAVENVGNTADSKILKIDCKKNQNKICLLKRSHNRALNAIF